jgi:hypothetical protein
MGLQMYKATHDSKHLSSFPEVAELMAGMTNSGDNYLCARKLSGMPVKILADQTYIGSTECGNSPAMVIYGPDNTPVNVLAVIANPYGEFEDVLIPGAPLAGCSGRIGAASESIIVVETFAAGLALHYATGHGVVVALYAENIETVVLSLKQRYPEASIVICAGKHEGSDGRSNMRNVGGAALAADNCLVAVPAPAATFDELYRTHGEEAVVGQVAAKAPPKSFAFSSPSSPAFQDVPDAPMLWPNQVNGPSMMEALVAQAKKHIVMTEEDFTAFALWVLFTYTIDVARVSPVLAIRSPIKRCGKTSAMTLLAGVVAKPYSVSNISVAVLYRLVDEKRPTLLLDESDTYLGESDKTMIGILNSGHTRTNAHVARMDQGKVRSFSTYCAKAIAGIGENPHTLKDRSVEIRLRRKLPDEIVKKYVQSPNDEIVALRAQIARWAADNQNRIARARPMPTRLDNDRHQDNWEPLLAIAACLSEEWLQKAYQAAHALSKSHDETKCGGEELLRDIRNAFEYECTSKLSTISLIEILCSDREGPWASFSSTKPITPRDIANLLADFDIASKNLRIGGGVVKGYEFTQFEDAFARYVRDPSP